MTFFATADDLRELLLRVEAGTPMHYARLGVYSTQEPPVHRSASDIADLGERGGSKFIDPVFYLLPPGSAPACKPVKLARGGPWFSVDQRQSGPNRAFAVLRHCVLEESGELEQGSLSNPDDQEPVPLFLAIKEEMARGFAAVEFPSTFFPVRWIGPEAMRLLQSGEIHFSSGGSVEPAESLSPCIVGRAVYRVERIKAVWRTTEVVRLVSQVQASQDFSVLPVLADALEEAGCTDREILDHCRMAGKHVKGCWAVELLAGNDPPAKPGKKSRKKR